MFMLCAKQDYEDQKRCERNFLNINCFFGGLDFKI